MADAFDTARDTFQRAERAWQACLERIDPLDATIDPADRPAALAAEEAARATLIAASTAYYTAKVDRLAQNRIQGAQARIDAAAPLAPPVP